jgi:hypothetical protein
VVATGQRSSAPHPRRDFGPTLPTLLRERFGLSDRALWIGVSAIVALAIVAVVIAAQTRSTKHFVHHDPTFNVTYDGSVFHRGTPRDDELFRIEGRAPRLVVTLAVRPLRLPAFRGNVVHAFMPVWATGYVRDLSRSFDHFQLHDEGKARASDATGYQLGFRAGTPKRLTFGRDIVLLPAETGVRDALVVSLRQRIAGPLGPRGEHAIDVARDALHSFAFGTESP